MMGSTEMQQVALPHNSDPGLILVSGYSLCNVLHVLPVFMWVSFRFSSKSPIGMSVQMRVSMVPCDRLVLQLSWDFHLIPSVPG